MKKIFGVGTNDFDGKVTYIESFRRKEIKSYRTWKNMIQRCYSYKYKEKFPTYNGCTVSKEWLSYSNFKKWFDINYPYELAEEIRFELDKDLFFENVKIYSKRTCIFLPQSINTFIIKKSSSKFGFIGVSFHKGNQKFQAQINDFSNGKYKHLGYFGDPVTASEVYTTAREYNANLAKQYMRDLGIYSEKIINKIK